MKRQRIASLALMAAPLALAAAVSADLAGMPGLRGVAVGGSGDGYQGPGVYDLPGESGSGVTVVRLDDALKATAGAVASGDRLFAAVPEGTFFVSGMTYYLWDTSSWEVAKSADGDTDFKANAMASNPLTGETLGCFGEGYSSTLAPFDLATFAVDEFEEKSVNTTLYAMAYAADGTLYGIDGDGVLYRYNPSSIFSPLAEIGETGIRCDAPGAAVIDAESGVMYYVRNYSESTSLWRVDPATASSAKVYDMPGDMAVVCLWVEPGEPAADPLTPPYSENFQGPEMPPGYVNINNNEDYSKWTFTPGCLVYDYSSAAAADDYIVLPPMMLEGGSAYTFSFDAKSEDAENTERAAVYVGTAPEVGALTTVVVPPTDITNHGAYATYEGVYVPPSTGVYYFAVKACSDAGKFNLYVTGLKVSAPSSAAVPEAPKSLAAVPADYGELMVTLSFTAPSADLAGKPLGSLEKVEVYRGDALIESLRAVPGEHVSRDYAVEAAGQQVFRVVGHTSSGAGLPAEASCHAGLSTPLAPSFISAIEGENDGQLLVSWAPVDRDVNGMRMRAGQVGYTLYRVTGAGPVAVAEGLKTTSYADQAVAEGGGQTFLRYVVKAVNSAGSSGETATGTMIAGAPYALPFAESFAGGHTSYPFGIEAEGDEDTRWDIPTPQVLFDPAPQDNDGGLLRFIGSGGDSGTLLTGRLSLAGTLRPTLTFHYYASWGADNTNTIEVSASSGGDFTPLRKFTLGGEPGWVKATVDLSRYIGRSIQLRFVARTDYTRFILIDNIRVADFHDYNLSALSLAGPPRAVRGKESRFALTVGNDGALAADGYEAVLLRDGAEVCRKAGPAIGPDATASVELTDILSPFSPDEVVYTAVIELAADGYPADNVAGPLAMAVSDPRHPAPGGLRVESADGSTVNLAWDAPVLDISLAEPETDGAEDYKAFSTGLPGSAVTGDDVGAWKMVDADGLPSYGARTYPGLNRIDYPNAQQPSAFQVFTPYGLDGIESGFEPRSGSQLWVCFDAKSGRTDDWMISPELAGIAQTAKFFARSAKPEYGLESMEVLASATGTELSDFIPVTVVGEVSADWTEYSAELPEGTRHMAIRCTSDDVFALLVDDITVLTAEVAGTHLELRGYRVYRDGESLAGDVIADERFSHGYDSDGAAVTYHVTALYNEGESALSDGVVFDPSMSGVGTLREPEGASVSAVGSVITVAGTRGDAVAIHGADGRAVYSGKGDTRVSVAPGVYVVSVGGQRFKVAAG